MHFTGTGEANKHMDMDTLHASISTIHGQRKSYISMEREFILSMITRWMDLL